jgi:DNA-binding transcriptional ArsR family regulator
MIMMNDPQDLKQAARIFKSLSHPGRLQIACLLGSGRYVTQRDLIEKLGWPQSTVARHVGALRSGGLVTARRCGTEVHLALVEPVAHELMDAVCDWVHPETGEQFNHRLKELAGVASHEA